MINTASSTRYHHLDALRALLMMFGIPIHTGTLGSSYVFEKMTYLSSVVRMEAFFVISGFVCALIFSKYGGITTIKKRLQSIGIPLLAGLILLNPITNYLIYNYHNPPVGLFDYLTTNNTLDSPKGTMVWHLHLWFLFPLLAYGILTPGISRIIDILSQNAIIKNHGRKLNFLIIGTIIATCCLIARIVFYALSKSFLPESLFSFIIRESLYNFSFYTLGIMIFKSNYLFTVFHRSHHISLMISVVLVIIHYLLGANFGENISKLYGFFAYAFLAVALTNLLFTITAKVFDKDNKIIRFFSDASYTVYIFHYLTIYVLANIFQHLTSSTYILLPLIALITFVMTSFFHKYVISITPTLTFIFNGKRSK